MNLDDLQGRAVITVPEAGELLGLSRATAYRTASAGDIPTLDIGGRKVVPVPALLRMLGADVPTEADALAEQVEANRSKVAHWRNRYFALERRVREALNDTDDTRTEE